MSEVFDPLGTALEGLRLARGERLGRMASRLQISESYLHYIRAGKKPAPADFARRVGAAYGLSESEIEVIERAADRHRPSFQMALDGAEGREALGMLARSAEILTDEDYRAIEEIVARARERIGSDGNA